MWEEFHHLSSPGSLRCYSILDVSLVLGRKILGRREKGSEAGKEEEPMRGNRWLITQSCENISQMPYKGLSQDSASGRRRGENVFAGFHWLNICFMECYFYCTCSLLRLSGWCSASDVGIRREVSGQEGRGAQCGEGAEGCGRNGDSGCLEVPSIWKRELRFYPSASVNHWLRAAGE